jgi:hypothetical protein
MALRGGRGRLGSGSRAALANQNEGLVEFAYKMPRRLTRLGLPICGQVECAETRGIHETCASPAPRPGCHVVSGPIP